MYVRAENARLLRNFFFAFFAAAFLSLILVTPAFARTVDLSEWSDDKTANWMNGYIFSPFSYDGEKTEYISGADSITTGRYSNYNGSLILNSQVSGSKHYDKLQVFDIVNNDATSVSLGRKWRIVLLSASGETYGEYFEKVYVTYLDKMFCMFKANLDAGTWEDLNPGQVVVDSVSYTAPWAVVALYDNLDTIRPDQGWIINLVSPYYVPDRKSGNFSIDGTTRLNSSPGYASPREYGYSNGYGYEYASWEDIHIIKVYSEDDTFWYRRDQNDPPYSTNTGIDGTFNNQSLGYLSDIATNTYIETELQETANVILQAISSSNSLIAQYDSSIVDSLSYVQTSLLRIRDNTEDTADILDVLEHQVSTGISAIQTLQGTANTLQQAANSTLSTISTRVNTSNTRLSSIDTKLNNIYTALNGFGVSQFGDGGHSITQGINSTKSQLESSLNNKQPFYTMNQVSTWVNNVSTLSTANTYYVDLPIPFAGTVRFDCGSVLNMPVYGNLTIAYFLRYMTSLPILIGCLYVSYKMVMRTFGG